MPYSHFRDADRDAPLVLGANLGSAINPLLEGARRGDAASYRLPAGNMINRLVGVALVLPFLTVLAGKWQLLQADPSKMAAQFHIAFNLVLLRADFPAAA